MKPRTWNIGAMLRRRRIRVRMLGALALAAFGLSAVLITRIYWIVPPAPVTISAGNTEGVYHRYVQNFAAESLRDPVRLPLAPVVTAGTLDHLQRVDRGELDSPPRSSASPRRCPGIPGHSNIDAAASP